MNEIPATAALITVADRSVKAITAATAGLSKVVAEIVALGGISETLSADIQQKEGQLADLERQLNLSERNAKAELATRVAEAENVVLNELLTKNQLARITIVERNTVEDALNDALSGAAAAVEGAVKAAEAALHGKYNLLIKDMEADHKVANAEVNAKVTQLTDRNAFLVTELENARRELTAEREARIKIAQAEAGRQGVVVNAGKQ